MITAALGLFGASKWKKLINIISSIKNVIDVFYTATKDKIINKQELEDLQDAIDMLKDAIRS